MKMKGVQINETIVRNENGDPVGKIAVLVGGVQEQNPKGFMDKVVADYVERNPHNQFIVIQLDNPWTRIVTSNLQSFPFRDLKKDDRLSTISEIRDIKIDKILNDT
jgi:hypothetical protein